MVVIINDHEMQLVCCVVKKIRAFQKVRPVVNIWENGLLLSLPTALLKGDRKIISSPAQKKGHVYTRENIFKNIYIKWVYDET